MIIEQINQLGQARKKVWCLANDLLNNGDGTYSFANLSNEALGFASQVNVIDSNKVFLFDNTNGKLYLWTEGISSGEGGNVDIKVEYGTISTSSTTTTIYYSGDFVNAYAVDAENHKIEVDTIVELGYVTFTLQAKPSSQVNCVVIYV